LAERDPESVLIGFSKQSTAVVATVRFLPGQTMNGVKIKLEHFLSKQWQHG
jgi:hypothetical protein